ncbi:hypothetical protein [Cerasicoccus maritimus]|uniref:hypothetical protein n=1 Tax=Cerasicoccus maritimus TaxID=490089 RepID=UPI002852CD42|nr:hypothetical protein [Cerasicoccus maritimus]
MKLTANIRFGFSLLFILAAAALEGQVVEGEKLEPELGLYVDIDAKEWGAAKLNLRIVNNNFQAYFLDENDLLVAPPIDKMIVHYSNFIKKSQAKLTIMLEPAGMMMTSKRVIPPPYRYQVRIFLKKTVNPDDYYEESYEEKEFIGMHTLNQLGGDMLEKTTTEPTSVAPPAEEGAAEKE